MPLAIYAAGAPDPVQVSSPLLISTGSASFFRRDALELGHGRYMLVFGRSAAICIDRFLEALSAPHFFNNPGIDISCYTHTPQPWRDATPRTLAAPQGYVYRSAECKYTMLGYAANIASTFFRPDNRNVGNLSLVHIRREYTEYLGEFPSPEDANLAHISSWLRLRCPLLAELVVDLSLTSVMNSAVRPFSHLSNSLTAVGRAELGPPPALDTIVEMLRLILCHLHHFLDWQVHQLAASIVHGRLNHPDFLPFADSARRLPRAPSPIAERPVNAATFSEIRRVVDTMSQDPAYANTPGQLVLRDMAGASRAAEYLLGSRTPTNLYTIRV